MSDIKSNKWKEMVKVESGTYIMGSSNLDEAPVSNVIITKDFLIAKYTVTQDVWNVISDSNPSNFMGNNLPVENVSWFDAIEYCNKLSIKEGFTSCYTIDKGKKDPGNTEDSEGYIDWYIKCNFFENGYRLPTEAEWEYAARSGVKSEKFRYPGSNKVDEVAWYWDKNYRKTSPAGEKNPNELGLYDMGGNVQEWCWDWYGNYNSKSKTDPVGPSSGSSRVHRGGSWNCGGGGCTPTYRDTNYPYSAESDIGFRVVRCL